MKTFLNVLLYFIAAAPWLCFLPSLVYWQIPLSIISFVCAHLVLLYVCLTSSLRRRYFLSLLLVTSILSYYLINWTALPFKAGGLPIRVSLINEISDKFLSGETANLTLSASSLSMIGQPIYSLNQALGKVVIARLGTSDGQTFSVAFIKTDKIFSRGGWPKNRILLRRTTSILRQRQEPIIVVLRSNLPSGSSVVDNFMFQARLETSSSLKLWKSLLGLENDLLLGRDVSLVSE